jgi:hypothetical protein
MQRLEVSGAVRQLKWPLGVKWLKVRTYISYRKNVLNNFFHKYNNYSVTLAYTATSVDKYSEIRLKTKPEQNGILTFAETVHSPEDIYFNFKYIC